MPTIFILFGFRFMFYANDHEPIHVHVTKGDISAKFTLFRAKTCRIGDRRKPGSNRGTLE